MIEKFKEYLDKKYIEIKAENLWGYCNKEELRYLTLLNFLEDQGYPEYILEDDKEERRDERYNELLALETKFDDIKFKYDLDRFEGFDKERRVKIYILQTSIDDKILLSDRMEKALKSYMNKVIEE